MYLNDKMSFGDYSDLSTHRVDFDAPWDLKHDGDLIDMAFSKKRVEDGCGTLNLGTSAISTSTSGRMMTSSTRSLYG